MKMANMVLTSDLITAVRQRSDTTGSQFVTDAEILSILDNSYRKFYNLVVTTYEHYFISSTDISLIPGTAEYSLPADFFKLLGIDKQIGNQTFTLRPFSFADRNRQTAWRQVNNPARYILYGSKVKLIPTPANTDSIKLWYVPSPADLTTNTQIEVYNGFDEYIILDSAIKIMAKEESDISQLLVMLQDMERKIIDSMRDRDAGMASKVIDVQSLNDQMLYPWAGL